MNKDIEIEEAKKAGDFEADLELLLWPRRLSAVPADVMDLI